MIINIYNKKAKGPTNTVCFHPAVCCIDKPSNFSSVQKFAVLDGEKLLNCQRTYFNGIFHSHRKTEEVVFDN
jgi:hypothetical protein